MKIVHIELPRIFTLSVKEYMTEAAAALERGGHVFEQYDINPNFWKWVLGLSTPHSPGDLFGPLVNLSRAGCAGGNTEHEEAKGAQDHEAAPVDRPRVSRRSVDGNELWGILSEARAHLRDVSCYYGVPLTLAGIQLAKAVTDSSYAMCALVADNFGAPLFGNFFQHVAGRLKFLDADVISLGVESPEGIFWALQMASWLKSGGCAAHLCIGRHAWENFSLLPHIQALAKNPWFFGVISSVILYQEDLAQTLAGLVAALQHGDFSALHNVAIRLGDAVRVLAPREQERSAVRVGVPAYKLPAQYFEAMEVPAGRLVYSMAMVRNKCFYKKCTFCVQIAKHISDHAYSERAEITRALNGFEELARHGIELVNLMDEAMRPVDIQMFCAGIQARGIHMHWVGRMIAAANPNRDILRQMKAAGCTEILFGLETFDPRLSADMGKVSKSHDSAAETAAMVESFLDAGRFVILSMIYEFPTERAESRRATLESIERLAARSKRFAMIFNRFHLLHESAIYGEPAKFNIARVEQRPPENDLQYHFGYECIAPLGAACDEELATMQRLRLGLSPVRNTQLEAAHGRDLLDMAYFLDYVSVGFEHRVTCDATILAVLFDESILAAPR